MFFCGFIINRRRRKLESTSDWIALSDCRSLMEQEKFDVMLRLEQDTAFVANLRKKHGLPPTHGMAEYFKQGHLDAETRAANLVASTISDFKLICLKQNPNKRALSGETQSRNIKARSLCAMAYERAVMAYQ